MGFYYCDRCGRRFDTYEELEAHVDDGECDPPWAPVPGGNGGEGA